MQVCMFVKNSLCTFLHNLVQIPEFFNINSVQLFSRIVSKSSPNLRTKEKLHVIKFKSKIDVGLQAVFCKKKRWEILNQLILHVLQVKSQDLSENIVYSELQQGCFQRHINKKGQNKAELTLAPFLYTYVKTANNCNSSSINCNYGKNFGNEISIIHVYAQKRNSA